MFTSTFDSQLLKVQFAKSTKSISLTVALSLVASATAQERMPGFDILIGDLSVNNGGLAISNIVDVTQRPDAYDNQPYFLPSGNMMLYTRVYQNDGAEQTDSHIYNLVTKQSFRLSNTAESEYSPTLMPSNTQFSVIKAYGDQQKLWQYPLTSLDGEPMELLKDVNPVGYHAWVNDSQVILFVLGEPHTLQLANIDSGEVKELDRDIGASLYKIPGSDLMSYSVNVGTSKHPEWQVNSIDVTTGKKSRLAKLPKGAYYYGWSGDGQLLAAEQNRVLSYNLREHNIQEHRGWRQIGDISGQCDKGISRLTTNVQNTKIAMVCAR